MGSSRAPRHAVSPALAPNDDSMDAIPCRLCGYDAPGEDCPHCRLETTTGSLRDERVGLVQGIVDGARAVPMGLSLLVSTRGVKRYLIPPVILTTIAFVVVFWWTMGLVDLLVQAVEVEDMAELGLEDGWLKASVVWLMEKGVATLLARISGVLLWIVVSSVVALYMFSIVYEAIAGPFLDEIQGRIETRWFGGNPRDALERPTGIPVTKCVRNSVIAGAAGLALLLVPLGLTGFWAWLGALRFTIPFFVAAALDRDYAIWLSWVLRVEGHLLWVSIKASLVVLVLLVLFLPLKFLPLIGFWLYMAIAGFCTAITLLDIPFSRRGWTLTTRFQFLVRNWLAMVSFGGVSSLVFLVPILGPIVMVPAASIGGLWLLVRLDKDSLRPVEKRRSAQPPSPPSPAEVG